MPHTVLIGPTPGLARLVHLPTGKQWGAQGQERPQLAASVANGQRPMGGEVCRLVARARNQKSTNRAHSLRGAWCLGAWVLDPFHPPLHLAPGTWHWQQAAPAQHSERGKAKGLHSTLFSQTQTGPAGQSIPIPTPPPPSPPIPKPHLLNLAPSYRPSVLDLAALVCLLPSSLSRPDSTSTSSNLQNA